MYGERIKALRYQLRISQAELARQTCVSAPAVSSWQRDVNDPSEATKTLICNVYHVNRHWLETGEGEMLNSVDDYTTQTVLSALEGQSAVKRELMLMIAELPDDLLDQMLDRLMTKRKGQP